MHLWLVTPAPAGTVLEVKNKGWAVVRGGGVQNKSEPQNEAGMNAIQSHGVKMLECLLHQALGGNKGG